MLSKSIFNTFCSCNDGLSYSPITVVKLNLSGLWPYLSFISFKYITGLIFESYNNMDSVCESLSVSIDDERVKTIDVLS